MTTYTAQRTISATSETITRILTDIGQLSSWNPAINSIATTDSAAVVGYPYPAKTRLPGQGTLTYTAVESHLVQWRLESPGAIELGTWEATEHRNGRSMVTHTMEHSGPLMMLLTPGMAPVPGYRLDRLQLRAETSPKPRPSR